MNIRVFAFFVVLLLSAGCATLPDGTATPALARLSSEEMARLAPDAPRLLPDDLLAMARSGTKPEAIIEHFRQSGARFELTPGQVIDLQQRGLPLLVLEAIHADREKALRADFAQLLVEREQQCGTALALARDEERLRAQASADLFWPGCSSPFRRPGIFRRR